MVMTQSELTERWNAIVQEVKKNIPHLSYLQSRWMDEHEYEDFKDYEVEIKKLFPNLTLEKFKKRPFSFQIKIAENLGMVVKINSQEVSWKVARS
jgi:hypothetical protein